MPINGQASLDGTRRYVDRFAGKAAAGHFRQQQNLWLSSMGLGTYLGNADVETDERYTDSVTRAVQLGANVIDSAANYRFQRSERSLGEALQRLQEQGFQRDEIVICTKGGYLPFDGAPPRDVRRYVEETFVKTGVASFEDIVGGSHCMTPAYLQHQLEQSLRNLQVTAIDVYYIHNPESQLASINTDVFYNRLKLAFEMLEQKVNAGIIARYGVATWNGFRVSPDARDYHSLESMVAVAREIAGESHNFRFVQLPFNLGMTEALTVQNQSVNGSWMSLLEAAAHLNVTVVSSASILQGRVARGLPETIKQAFGALASEAQTAIQFVRSTPGITTALVGMSHLPHVEDNLALVAVAPASRERFTQLFESR